jgi:hypothetical protein
MAPVIEHIVQLILEAFGIVHVPVYTSARARDGR